MLLQVPTRELTGEDSRMALNRSALLDWAAQAKSS